MSHLALHLAVVGKRCFSAIQMSEQALLHSLFCMGYPIVYLDALIDALLPALTSGRSANSSSGGGRCDSNAARSQHDSGNTSDDATIEEDMHQLERYLYRFHLLIHGDGNTDKDSWNDGLVMMSNCRLFGLMFIEVMMCFFLLPFKLVLRVVSSTVRVCVMTATLTAQAIRTTTCAICWLVGSVCALVDSVAARMSLLGSCLVQTLRDMAGVVGRVVGCLLGRCTAAKINSYVTCARRLPPCKRRRLVRNLSSFLNAAGVEEREKRGIIEAFRLLIRCNGNEA
ncbi:unnamed protein product [Vitrella brassicaformis CCMP3155]|uniref:Uncharacterized protein n=2 Tax=Vitrella brassicaformis TaxID=1169539 RepID=A0A0G4H4M9_VITBC|nr:unnamed protein product [Vitrella brassicaformis CCMP3155]|mmetsp:Transcript_50763/g.127343  ORF Transcript_50763/g.127343 Transcript_50763/m.127343 type:complete len:283 (+) Transcript_50763:169-1017(+)|eukprot:CEM38749.1 unnamed protein product [Vitrella brassicaformis CCMP3155]